MKTIYPYLCISFIWLATACTIDFDPEVEPPADCLVVNAILQSDSLMTVRFYGMATTNSQPDIVPVEGVHVVLKENQTVVYNGTADSLLRLERYPQPEAVYSIEATHADYPPITAETRIPQAIRCTVAYEKDGMYRLSEFDFADTSVPLWITTSATFIDTTLYTQSKYKYRDFYCSHLLIDAVNRVEGGWDGNAITGSGYYEGFMRIKGIHLPDLSEVLFLPAYLHQSFLWYDKEFYGDEIHLIVASREYDQYCKTFYELLSVPYGGDDLSSIFYQPVHVYSNIQGGLGIFAGKAEMSYFFKAEPTI